MILLALFNFFFCLVGWHEYEVWDSGECLGDFAGFALSHRLQTTYALLQSPGITLRCKHCGRSKF